MFIFSYICYSRSITKNQHKIKVFECDCLFDTVFYLKDNFDDYIFFQITPITRPFIFIFNGNENDQFFICFKETVKFLKIDDEKYYDSCRKMSP